MVKTVTIKKKEIMNYEKIIITGGITAELEKDYFGHAHIKAFSDWDGKLLWESHDEWEYCEDLVDELCYKFSEDVVSREMINQES